MPALACATRRRTVRVCAGAFPGRRGYYEMSWEKRCKQALHDVFCSMTLEQVGAGRRGAAMCRDWARRALLFHLHRRWQRACPTSTPAPPALLLAGAAARLLLTHHFCCVFIFILQLTELVQNEEEEGWDEVCLNILRVHKARQG